MIPIPPTHTVSPWLCGGGCHVAWPLLDPRRDARPDGCLACEVFWHDPLCNEASSGYSCAGKQRGGEPRALATWNHFARPRFPRNKLFAVA
eukprot:5372356-Prymnesium_polylepis.1